MPPHFFKALTKMMPHLHITRTVALWCGGVLIAVGLGMAALTFHQQVRARHAFHDAEAMAEELRANGAIVENYHKVIGSSYDPSTVSSSPMRLGGYIVAGILIVGGSILIWKASSFPSQM